MAKDGKFYYFGNIDFNFIISSWIGTSINTFAAQQNWILKTKNIETRIFMLIQVSQLSFIG